MPVRLLSSLFSPSYLLIVLLLSLPIRRKSPYRRLLSHYRSVIYFFTAAFRPWVPTCHRSLVSLRLIIVLPFFFLCFYIFISSAMITFLRAISLFDRYSTFRQETRYPPAPLLQGIELRIDLYFNTPEFFVTTLYFWFRPHNSGILLYYVARSLGFLLLPILHLVSRP